MNIAYCLITSSQIVLYSISSPISFANLYHFLPQKTSSKDIFIIYPQHPWLIVGKAFSLVNIIYLILGMRGNRNNIHTNDQRWFMENVLYSGGEESSRLLSLCVYDQRESRYFPSKSKCLLFDYVYFINLCCVHIKLLDLQKI